jgi:hypothetical protein
MGEVGAGVLTRDKIEGWSMAARVSGSREKFHDLVVDHENAGPIAIFSGLLTWLRSWPI